MLVLFVLVGVAISVHENVVLNSTDMSSKVNKAKILKMLLAMLQRNAVLSHILFLGFVP